MQGHIRQRYVPAGLAGQLAEAGSSWAAKQMCLQRGVGSVCISACEELTHAFVSGVTSLPYWTAWVALD